MTRMQYIDKFMELFPNLADDVSETKLITGGKGIQLRSKSNKAKWYTFIMFSNGDWELHKN